MDLEALYSRLPIPLQNLAVTAEGWRINRMRYSAEFDEILSQYREREFLSTEEITRIRNTRLREFLCHAGRTVPHYQRLFRELSFDPAGVNSIRDIQGLPILLKGAVQRCPGEFISSAVPERACMHSHTSGTTGAGLRFPVTRRAHREQWAVWWRYRHGHGIDRSTPCLYFGGRSQVPLRQTRPPYWRTNRSGRALLFSAYHLSERTAADYLRAMASSGFPWMHGYPSLLSLLAGLSLQTGIRVPGIRWITLGAESLLPQQAQLIQQAFGVAPIEHYGMAEGVANISQCPRGRLHVDEDFSAVEFVPLESGGYRIVGTNFSNPAMPMIRYDSGDVADVADASTRCECGRPGRIVRGIDGRREDYVVTKRGAALGRLDHIFKDQVRIREAQIRQDRPGHMVLAIVRADRFTPDDEQFLRRETLKRVGDEVDFDIEYVDAVPRTASGKLRFVVSSVRAALPRPGRDGESRPEDARGAA